MVYLRFYKKIGELANSTDFVFSDVQAYLAGTSSLVIGVIGFIFNVLIIAALLKYKTIRVHVTTPFVISMSMSDILFSGLVLPLQGTKFILR